MQKVLVCSVILCYNPTMKETKQAYFARIEKMIQIWSQIESLQVETIEADEDLEVLLAADAGVRIVGLPGHGILLLLLGKCYIDF